MTAEKSTERVFVSACLLGRRCKYDGGSNTDTVLERELAERGLVPVPFCPEEVGGLGTPRPPADLTDAAERVLEGRAGVRTESGDDVTEAFRAGAEAALELCRREGLTRAFLKERSPSCGCTATHVGGEVVAGPGLTTALLSRHGIECHGVEGRRGAAAQDARPAGAREGAERGEGPQA